MNNKLLLYMHVPKTGGTSFTQAISDNCPNILHYLGLNSDQLNEKLDIVDAVCGHFSYGIHKETGRSYQYVTMLRHPYQRALSFFYFKYKNPNYLPTYNKDLTFEEYLLNPANDKEYCNLQSRMIIGKSDNLHPNFKKVYSQLTMNFSFVGFTEHYDISLYLFMRMMNWEPKHYTKVGVTHYRPSNVILSKETMKLFIQKNETDLKLYEHTYRQFVEKLSEQTNEQQKQLKAYLRAARNRN